MFANLFPDSKARRSAFFKAFQLQNPTTKALGGTYYHRPENYLAHIYRPETTEGLLILTTTGPWQYLANEKSEPGPMLWLPASRRRSRPGPADPSASCCRRPLTKIRRWQHSLPMRLQISIQCTLHKPKKQYTMPLSNYAGCHTSDRTASSQLQPSPT